MKRGLLCLLIALGVPVAGIAGEDAPAVLVSLEVATLAPEPRAAPVLGLLRYPEVWGALGALEDTWHEQEDLGDLSFDDVMPWFEEVLGEGRLETLGLLSSIYYAPQGNDRTRDLRRLAIDMARQIEVDIEVRAPRGETTSGQVLVGVGRRASLLRTQTRHVLSNYNPELACDNSGGERPSAVGNPEIVAVHDGVAADVRAYDLEPGGRIAVEVMVQVAALASRVEPTRAKYLGSVEFPTSRGAFAVISAVVRPDVPSESVLRVNGDEYRVRLTARRHGPEAERGHRGTLRRYDVGFHVLPHWFALARQGEGDNRQMLRPFVDFLPPNTETHVFGEMIMSRAPLTKFAIDANGALFVSGRLADQRVVRDALRELADSAAAGVEIELTLRAHDEKIAHCRMPSIDGRPSLARVGLDQAAFLDADVEVG